MSNSMTDPMTDPVQALLAQSALKNTQFTNQSRYYGIDTTTLVSAQGQVVGYLRRRLLPDADQFQLLEEYRTRQGDRLDNLAAHFLGDPELFWRMCDANNAMRPEALTDTLARVLRITLPQGVAGVAL